MDKARNRLRGSTTIGTIDIGIHLGNQSYVALTKLFRRDS